MDIDFSLFDNDHVPGDCAMRPIATRLTRQAALLRLVGISLLRCLPCLARQSRHTQAHSTAVSRFKDLIAARMDQEMRC